MADYIYLMQNRLSPAQWRALETVREAARAHNMPVFLVGGAVRDLTSGSPVRDLDFAVQGDAGGLRQELEDRGASVAGENPVLSSLYLAFRGGVRAEVGPTLTVTYPKPGQPVTEPATILDDLRRRDFTANAMAVSLNEGSYGLLLDPLNGTADIENREFRLVSPYGFIEQPALLLRAARLSERLGWTLEERTQSRYETSKEEGHIQALPASDRGYELEEVFHEEDPVEALAHLESEGWRDVLFPSLRLFAGERGGLDDVRELVGQMDSQGLHPDPSAVFFPVVTAKLSEGDLAALKGLFPRQGFVRQIDTLEGRSKELAAQLTARTAAAPSETWRILMDADPEVTLYLALHSRTGAVAGKIRSFLREWPQMRQKIPYALMQEMRITPDLPVYEKLLDDLFFALIDGKLDTVEATRAFLEPYSPPAPPQVAVRRRPAKSTRTRAKRAAEERAEEKIDADDDETSAEPDAEDGEETSAHDRSDEEQSDLDKDTDLEEDDDEATAVDDTADEPAEPVPAPPAKAARVKSARPSSGVESTERQAPADPGDGAKVKDSPESAKKVAAPVAVKASTPAPAKAKAAVNASPSVPSAPAARDLASRTVAKKAATESSGKSGIASATAAKTSPAKAAAKSVAVKGTPEKSVAKKVVVIPPRPVKATEAKAAKPAVVAKSAKTPAKTVAPVKAKAVVKPSAPARPANAGKPVVAPKKVPPPAKGAKKVASKGRSR